MVQLTNEKDKLTARIVGEIDHHSARDIRDRVDENLRRSLPRQLVFDFRDVSFMDSSGVGLIMGRYKLVASMGGEIVIRNMSPHIAQIVKLAGLSKIATVEEEEE